MHNAFLWLHVAAAVLFIGPMTIAMTTVPRYIRTGDLPVVRFLHRTTRVYGFLSLLVLLFGLELGRGEFKESWLSTSMGLFILGIALLFAIVEPDQRRAIAAMQADGNQALPSRIRLIGAPSLIALIWLAILALMVWQP
jgi:hypothetical protein